MSDAPYREIAPPRGLAAYVDRFWTRASTRAGEAHRVLPDGCIDLLVDLASGTAEIVGPMREAALVPSEPGRIVAVRFRPGAGARLTGVPLDALVDAAIPARDIGLDARALVDALDAADDEPARIAILARFVHDRLEDADPLDRTVRRAVDRLARGPGASVASIADELGVSRQYLARVFARDVGLPPKTLARIARIQRVVLAIRGGRRDWAALARELGFADQAHLVHDAGELTGLTPTTLADEVSISPIASIYGAPESATRMEHLTANRVVHRYIGGVPRRAQPWRSPRAP